MKIYARMSSVPCYKLFPSEIITVDRWRYFVLWQLASSGGARLMCSVLHAEAHKQWALWLVGHLPNWICETMSAIWLVAVRSRRRHWHKACKTWSTATRRDVGDHALHQSSHKDPSVSNLFSSRNATTFKKLSMSASAPNKQHWKEHEIEVLQKFNFSRK